MACLLLSLWSRKDHAMIRLQRTIKNSISCEGIGLHTGKPVRMKLNPAPTDTGVVFIRTDRGNARIRAIGANTAATSYATTLSQNGITVDRRTPACGVFRPRH